MTDVYLFCPNCRGFQLAECIYAERNGEIRQFKCSHCENSFRDGKKVEKIE